MDSYLLPFFEQQALFDRYDFLLRTTDSTDNAEVAGTEISTLICPSNIVSPRSRWQLRGLVRYAKGNYAPPFSAGSAWGRTFFFGTEEHGFYEIHRAIFNGRYFYGATMAQIRDGTSNVILYGEQLISGHDNDSRGAWAHPGGAFISAGNQAAQVGYRLIPNGNALDDRMADKPTNCRSMPLNDPQLRCFTDTSRPNQAARSNHPGGVHICKADASVHFVSNTIDTETWVHMFAIASGHHEFEVWSY